jgi:hypothetical protein
MVLRRLCRTTSGLCSMWYDEIEAGEEVTGSMTRKFWYTMDTAASQLAIQGRTGSETSVFLEAGACHWGGEASVPVIGQEGSSGARPVGSLGWSVGADGPELGQCRRGFCLGMLSRLECYFQGFPRQNCGLSLPSPRWQLLSQEFFASNLYRTPLRRVIFPFTNEDTDQSG